MKPIKFSRERGLKPDIYPMKHLARPWSYNLNFYPLKLEHDCNKLLYLQFLSLVGMQDQASL